MSRSKATKTPFQRLWERVETQSSGCWVWTGPVTTVGYGQVFIDGHRRAAHRVAWETFVGPIPDGKFIDHKCHEKRCVNPAHLRPATNAENMQNRIGAPAHSTTGVRGVSWHKGRGRYVARVGLNGKRISGGYFETIEEAAEAASELRRRYLPFSIADQHGVVRERCREDHPTEIETTEETADE